MLRGSPRGQHLRYERLRNTTKTQLSRIEMAKQVLATVAGISPEQILILDAQAHPQNLRYASCPAGRPIPATDERHPRSGQERHHPLSMNSYSWSVVARGRFELAHLE